MCVLGYARRRVETVLSQFGVVPAETYLNFVCNQVFDVDAWLQATHQRALDLVTSLFEIARHHNESVWMHDMCARDIEFRHVVGSSERPPTATWLYHALECDFWSYGGLLAIRDLR
jgi:hypothetical protein